MGGRGCFLGLSPSARAEELNLSQWVELARVYDTNPLKDVAQSGDELFDIVDELNQVTGQGTRREIHEGSLRHRAVHMFLVNKHGAVLLQKRSLWKDRQPGKWDSSAAGHLDAGESYEEAAVRELKEELGCPAAGCRKSRILTPEKITAGNSSPSMKGGIPGRFVFRRRRWTACSGSRRSKSRRGWNAVRRISRLRSFPAGMHGWSRIEKIILTQIHIMINPDQLSPEQIQSIRTWAEEGLDLNAIQKRLHEDLNIKLTFMDTRFLLQDLDIRISQPEPEPEAEQPGELPGTMPPPASLLGKTQVTVDEITPPHALMAGKVLFKSGAQGAWDIDRTGRINWDVTLGEPTADDLREFETELQSVIRSRMGAM